MEEVAKLLTLGISHALEIIAALVVAPVMQDFDSTTRRPGFQQ